MKITAITTALFLLVSLQAKAIINGDVDTSSRYDSVGSLNTDGNPFCTATVIASKWIVTAAHCTFQSEASEEEGNGAPLPPSAYSFVLGKDSSKPSATSTLKRWVRIPGEIDLAFGELSKALPLNKLKITPAKPIVLNTDLTGNFVSVGFGQPLEGIRQLAHLTATFSSGNVLEKLFKTHANIENYITQNHSEEINLEYEPLESIIHLADLTEGYNLHVWDARGRENLNNIVKPTSGWQDTCFGDSGGPLFKEVDGKLGIVGVTSRGLNRTCAPIGTVVTTFGPEVMKVFKSLKIK